MRVPPFLTKLYTIVDDEQGAAAGTVGWTANGTALRIADPARFADECLPRYFKHNKLGSFQQQLLTYGFTRLPNESCLDVAAVWQHAQFQRGRPELLEKIHRAASKHAKRSSSSRDGSRDRGGGGATSSGTAIPGKDVSFANEEELAGAQQHIRALCDSVAELHGQLRAARRVEMRAIDDLMSHRRSGRAARCRRRPTSPAEERRRRAVGGGGAGGGEANRVGRLVVEWRLERARLPRRVVAPRGAHERLEVVELGRRHLERRLGLVARRRELRRVERFRLVEGGVERRRLERRRVERGWLVAWGRVVGGGRRLVEGRREHLRQFERRERGGGSSVDSSVAAARRLGGDSSVAREGAPSRRRRRWRWPTRARGRARRPTQREPGRRALVTMGEGGGGAGRAVGVGVKWIPPDGQRWQPKEK